jgi:hypothetical protein
MGRGSKIAAGWAFASAIGQTALQVSDYHNNTLAVALGLSMAAPLVYLAFHLTNDWREKRGEPGFSMEPTYIVIAALVVALVAAIWGHVIRPSTKPIIIVKEQIPSPQPLPTGIRLQFFGDNRIPTVISRNNVAVNFSYFTPSLSITPQDAKGKAMAGGMQIPPNWVIFLSFDKPAIYTSIAVDFSNPAIMPIIDRQFQGVRAIVVSTRGQVPAGVLDIHTEQ